MNKSNNSMEMYAKANGDKYNGDGRRSGGILPPWMFGLYDSMPAMTNRLTDRISMATKTAISAHMPSLVPAPEGVVSRVGQEKHSDFTNCAKYPQSIQKEIP